MRFLISCVLLGLLAGQGGGQPDWGRTDAETLDHFQALIRFDTSDPPGGEKPAVDYLKGVLEREGIPVELFALEPHRPNLVARLKGTGKKRPLLIIEAGIKKHFDAVTLPTMSTGATDMAYLRAKDIQCFGVGPATDIEEGPKGFGAHSDQERILESELQRFVKFYYELVLTLAGSR